MYSNNIKKTGTDTFLARYYMGRVKFRNENLVEQELLAALQGKQRACDQW
jgi:hypothetical protein